MLEFLPNNNRKKEKHKLKIREKWKEKPKKKQKYKLKRIKRCPLAANPLPVFSSRLPKNDPSKANL